MQSSFGKDKHFIKSLFRDFPLIWEKLKSSISVNILFKLLRYIERKTDTHALTLKIPKEKLTSDL